MWKNISLSKSTEFDLYNAIEKIVGESWELQSELNDKHISVNYMNLWTTMVHGNESLVLRVLRNLLSNAIKFSPEESSIDIYTKMVEGWVEVFVEDEGRGIVKEYQNDLFGENMKTQEGTFGERWLWIALTIIRKFVDYMGWELKLVSSATQEDVDMEFAKKTWTIFSFILPNKK